MVRTTRLAAGSDFTPVRWIFPGDSFTERLHFGGHSGDLPFDIAGGPDYYLYLQVTRLS